MPKIFLSDAVIDLLCETLAGKIATEEEIRQNPNDYLLKLLYYVNKYKNTDGTVHAFISLATAAGKSDIKRKAFTKAAVAKIWPRK